ncbi:MAG: ATP-binding protein [Desulfobacterales bacterium]
MREISQKQVIRKIKVINSHWESGDVDLDIKRKNKRKYFDLFFPLVQAKVQRAVVLMGPRRVGKTVLLWQTIQKLIVGGVSPKSIMYVSLDDPIFLPFSLEDLLDLYKEIFSVSDLSERVIIFDEIQYLKNWDVQLKVLVDNYKQTKFIASGSAAAALNRKSKESGAGRFTDFMLPPLTFYEYLDLLKKVNSFFDLRDKQEILRTWNIDGLNQEFIKYLNYGGFPEAVFSEEVQYDPQRYIQSDIIDKVLLRDLPSLYGIHDIQELNRLFYALAYQTGNEVSLEKLSQSSGVAKNTIKKYLEYLEAAFLIRKVKRMDDSGKRFQRENFFKVYLTNPSMYTALYGPVSEDDSLTLGSLVETAIFSQWMHNPQVMDRIFYARWKGGKGEVDLVRLASNFKIIECLEVKWSDQTNTLKNLIQFCTNCNLKTALITTKTGEQESKVINGINLNFWASSVYCFVVGYLIIQGKSIT